MGNLAWFWWGKKLVKSEETRVNTGVGAEIKKAGFQTTGKKINSTGRFSLPTEFPS